MVYLTTVDGTARAKTDYVPLKRHEVVFKPGQSWATVKVERVESSDWQTSLFFTCVVEGLVAWAQSRGVRRNRQ